MFVCLFVNMITSQPVSIGWWNLGVGALYKNLGPSANLGVIAPWCTTPKMWRWATTLGTSAQVSTLTIIWCSVKFDLQLSVTNQSMDCEAKLALKYLFVPTFGCFWTILTCKVGQFDLVFDLWSGFISRSVHARPQVSVCSGYDLWHPG